MHPPRSPACSSNYDHTRRVFHLQYRTYLVKPKILDASSAILLASASLKRYEC